MERLSALFEFPWINILGGTFALVSCLVCSFYGQYIFETKIVKLRLGNKEKNENNRKKELLNIVFLIFNANLTLLGMFLATQQITMVKNLHFPMILVFFVIFGWGLYLVWNVQKLIKQRE